MRARTEKLYVLVENTNGITPTGKAANPCQMEMDCKKKDLHGYRFVSEQVEFLCLG